MGRRIKLVALAAAGFVPVGIALWISTVNVHAEGAQVLLGGAIGMAWGLYCLWLNEVL